MANTAPSRLIGSSMSAPSIINRKYIIPAMSVCATGFGFSIDVGWLNEKRSLGFQTKLRLLYTEICSI